MSFSFQINYLAHPLKFEQNLLSVLILKILIVIILHVTTLFGGTIIRIITAFFCHKIDYYRSDMYPVRIPARTTLPDYAATQQDSTRTRTMARPSPATQNESRRTANPPTSFSTWPFRSLPIPRTLRTERLTSLNETGLPRMCLLRGLLRPCLLRLCLLRRYYACAYCVWVYCAYTYCTCAFYALLRLCPLRLRLLHLLRPICCTMLLAHPIDLQF